MQVLQVLKHRTGHETIDILQTCNIQRKNMWQSCIIIKANNLLAQTKTKSAGDSFYSSTLKFPAPKGYKSEMWSHNIRVFTKHHYR